MLKKGYRIGYGYDILKSLKIGYYILKISCSKKGLEIYFLEIFGYRIGYKYPLIYILPVSAKTSGSNYRAKLHIFIHVILLCRC
jgi:hypothetical protein